MDPFCPIAARCRLEAARLIQLARDLLPRQEEEMIVSHLGHALEALDALSDQYRRRAVDRFSPAKLAQTQDPDLQEPAPAHLDGR